MLYTWLVSLALCGTRILPSGALATVQLPQGGTPCPGLPSCTKRPRTRDPQRQSRAPSPPHIIEAEALNWPIARARMDGFSGTSRKPTWAVPWTNLLCSRGSLLKRNFGQDVVPLVVRQPQALSYESRTYDAVRYCTVAGPCCAYMWFPAVCIV